MIPFDLIVNDTVAALAIPVLIFLARVADVTFGTMRIIFVSRGLKMVAPVLAFFEILIWLLAIGQVFSNLTNIANYLAYAGGFALGNYVGILVEEKVAMGLALVRIITQHDASELLGKLKSGGFGMTVIDAEGKHGQVKLIFAVVKRKEIPAVLTLVNDYNPHSFYTIEDVRSASGGIFPGPVTKRPRRGVFRFSRKGK
ncbi:MAG: DUF2179 domain-containing protein [Methanomicrobiaceae archaeon]|nr:DUF2179 domain-containing protein [Methanomicrobiaceae archaeon]